MPRKARLDAPGVLQHVIARGIERRPIFSCDEDYEFLLKRLGHLLEETDIECFAWVLIPNHFHLLLRTGSVWAVLLGKLAEQWGLSPEDLLSGSKERSVVRVRSVLSYIAVRKMGMRAT